MLKKATWRGVTLPALLSVKLPLPRGGFIQRRLLFLVPQLVAVSIIAFLLIRLLPGNPARQLVGPFATEQQIAALEEKLGLHENWFAQYGKYIGQIFQGDFGDSVFTSQPVAKDIRERLPRTVELITIALFFSLIIMVPLGIRAAAPKQTGRAAIFDRSIGRGINLYGLLAGSLADFWLALILIFIFYTQLDWAPSPSGALDLGVAEPDRVSGFLTIDSIITGNLDALRSYLAHLVLPLVTLVFVYGGPILKATMSAMREIQESPYMENAQAMGLKLRTRRRYAFRNALPPVITMVGVVYGFLLGGAVLVETVFGLNGIGKYGVDAVVNADYAPVQSFVLVAAVFVMAVYLIVDMLHAWSDPRIRL